MDEKTVRIPRVPQPANHVWLGALFTAAGLSWAAMAVLIAVLERTERMLLQAGLAGAFTVTLGAVAVWTRHSLQSTTSQDHAQLSNLLTSQHVMVMTELREQRKLMEETGGHAIAQLQALGIKVGKVAELPGYWDGFADALTDMGMSNVVSIKNHRER